MVATRSATPGRAGGGRRAGLALGAAWLALAAATGACRPVRYGGGGGGGGAAGGGGGATVDGDCQPLAPIARRIWRLSIPQYANSVRDLLGLPAAPMIAAGANANGGQTFLVDDSLSLDPDLALQIDGTAHGILTGGTVDPSGLAACQGGETEDACARRFAQTFGRRAFRRPLASDEVADLLVVYADGRQQDFASGIALMAEALLISPSFLFRTELGAAATGTTTLTPYEVASQLSYTFVDSTPDAPLLDAAGSGALATEGGIGAQVDRLLATAAARQNVDRIVANWLHAGNLALQKKDWGLLSRIGGPDADQNGVAADLHESLVQFVDGTLWSPGGRLTSLLSSSEMFVNQRLASLYGVPFGGASPETLVRVTQPDRGGGILAQPAFLWAITESGVSPIARRGTILRDDIVCDAPITNPAALHRSPGVATTLMALATEMQRSTYALTNDPCRTCHAQLDPYGRVLQAFDAVGNSRVTVEDQPVDASGDFSNAPPLAGTITGPSAFAAAITANGQFVGCAVQKMSSYALGRTIQGAQICETRRLTAAFAASDGSSDGSIAALFRQVALAPFVRARGGASP